jgi:exonuclease SbcC
MLTLEARKSAIDEMLADFTNSQLAIQATLDRQNTQLTQLTATQAEYRPVLGNRPLTIPAERMLSTAKAEVTGHQDFVGQLKAKLRTIADAQTRLADLNEQLQDKVTLSNHMKTLSDAFGRNGIQGMIIEEFAVPALEEEANRILSQMSNNQLYLSIKMQRPTQNQGTVERLDIVVSDAQGTRQLEAFSGGEAFRISFALRIALSKLLARRAGRRLETLIIDEGFGTQDEEGREHLVEAINSVSDEFRIILVITHIQEVRDLFPVQINIKHSENRSTWEVLS